MIDNIPSLDQLKFSPAFYGIWHYEAWRAVCNRSKQKHNPICSHVEWPQILSVAVSFRTHKKPIPLSKLEAYPGRWDRYRIERLVRRGFITKHIGERWWYYEPSEWAWELIGVYERVFLSVLGIDYEFRHVVKGRAKQAVYDKKKYKQELEQFGADFTTPKFAWEVTKAGDPTVAERNKLLSQARRLKSLEKKVPKKKIEPKPYRWLRGANGPLQPPT